MTAGLIRRPARQRVSRASVADTLAEPREKLINRPFIALGTIGSKSTPNQKGQSASRMPPQEANEANSDQKAIVTLYRSASAQRMRHSPAQRKSDRRVFLARSEEAVERCQYAAVRLTRPSMASPPGVGSSGTCAPAADPHPADQRCSQARGRFHGSIQTIDFAIDVRSG